MTATTPSVIEKAASIDRLIAEIDTAIGADPAAALPTPQDIEQLAANLTLAVTRLPGLLGKVAGQMAWLADHPAGPVLADPEETAAVIRLARGSAALRNQGIIAAWELRGALDQARADAGRVRRHVV